jgi:hypothetical protein
MMEYIQATDKDSVRKRVESFVSLGAPACDVCRDIHYEERPDEGSFWPDAPIHYVRADKRSAAEFWATTVCEHHDEFDHVPEGATHRVVDEPEYIGDDPDRGNSDTLHHATDVQELQL